MTNSPAVLLGKLRISSAPRELPHIPLEVAQQIARYLDHRSAFALTLTCRSLREAGETSLYESIDLTSGWGNDNGDNDPSDAGMREDTLHACQRSVASRIRAFEHAISCYAYRKDCMKVFRVEPSGGALDPNRSNARLLQLISMFSKQLVRLDIVSLPSVRSSTPAQSPSRSRAGFTTYTGSANIVDHFGFYNGLCRPRTSSTEVTFPRLKILRMCIPSSVDRMIPYVLKYFTNAQAPLRELHLAATSHAWTSSELTRRSPANFREIATPTLPHLEHLTIYEPARDSRGDLLLACLLKSAPNLGSVRIKEATVPLYSYNEYKPTRALKELVCLPADHTYNLSRCSGLEKHVEDMVVQYTSLSESEEVAQLSLPILPTARRITVLTSYRPDLSEYAQAGSGPAPTYKGKPYPVCASPLYLFESIEAMPHLETIMLAYEDQPCPGLYQADYTDCDFFIPSTEWERKGCRGLVIRQYRNHANTEQTFIHVRSLTRVVDAFECPTYMAFRRFWCDYASFGGQQVDRKTLEKVYKLGGMERGWSTGGRELEMPDAAWEVLQAAISRDEEASMMEDAGFDEYEQDGEVCKWVTGSEPWAVL